MYDASITIKHDIDAIEKLFSSEPRDFGRATYTIYKKNKSLTFEIHASDATALKIAANTIIKILTVWEKVEHGKHPGKN